MENAPGVVADDPGARLDLSAAINHLPRDERSALLLCLMARFSHEEAAQIMGLTVRNLKSLVANARQKLTKIMGDDDAGR